MYNGVTSRVNNFQRIRFVGVEVPASGRGRVQYRVEVDLRNFTMTRERRLRGASSADREFVSVLRRWRVLQP